MGCLQSYFRKAHTAALSPSSTRDQDGLNHNTDTSKIQLQQQEPVTDDVTTKVDIPMDFAPHSPASDSGAASAASTPASSPVRPPREKNKPQAVRAKLTTTGDRHHSPIFQQAMQTAFTADSLSQSRASKTPEPLSPKSRTSTPVENSDSNETTSHGTKDRKDENIILTSQSAWENKPSSPVQNNEAIVIKDVNSSVATSPENKSFKDEEKKSEESRFITTPVNEIVNIFPVVAKTISSTEENTSPIQSPPPSSPTKDEEYKEVSQSTSPEEQIQEDDNSKVESEVKPAEIPVAKEDEIVAEAANNVSSSIQGDVSTHEENIVSPAVSPNKPEDEIVKPEDNIVSASQSPAPEIVNEISVSAASKHISELGSEDFKPQTPEVVVQSPDQSTFDDVSAAVLVEDEADVPMQPMQAVEEAEETDAEVMENIATETTEEVATNSDVPQDKNIEENTGEEVKSPENEVKETSKAEEKSSTPVKDEPEVMPDLETKEEKESNVASETKENTENVTEVNSTAEPIKNVADDNSPEEHVENICVEEKDSLVETQPEKKTDEEVNILPEESENNEEQCQPEDKSVASPEVPQPEVLDETLNELSAPAIIELLPEEKLSEEQTAEEIKIESQDGVDAIQSNNVEEIQVEDEQNVQEVENSADVVAVTATSADDTLEMNNPETGSPIQSQSEVLIQDEETGIVSEAEDKSSIFEDKIANYVAMSPEVTEDKNGEAEITKNQAVDTNNEIATSDITEAIASPIQNDTEVVATEDSNPVITSRASSVQEIKTSENENLCASPLEKIANEEIGTLASPVEDPEIEKNYADELIKESTDNNAAEELQTSEEAKKTEESIIPEESQIPEECENPEEFKGTEETNNTVVDKDSEETKNIEDVQKTEETEEIVNPDNLETAKKPEDIEKIKSDEAVKSAENLKNSEETENSVETKDAVTSGDNINDQNMINVENPDFQESEVLKKENTEGSDTEVKSLSPEKMLDTTEEQEETKNAAPADATGEETIAKSDDISDVKDLIEEKSEQEITLEAAADPSQEVKIIDEAKLSSPTPPPSPVQSMQEENTLDEVGQSLSDETEHIDEASGEIEKVQSQSEDADKKESEKSEPNLTYPVPSTSIGFTPATPSQSPTNENENKDTSKASEVDKLEKQDDEVADITVDKTTTKDESNKEADQVIESTEIDSIDKTVDPVVVESPVPEENITNEIITQQSFNDEVQHSGSIIETSQETGEILPVQSSTEQETVIQVTQEEPTPSDSQSSLLGNEGLGAVSSVVIRYSLSEVNENPDESNEEIIINTKEIQLDEEETDKTEDEIKEEQEIADTLIAAVRESEETATDTASCENNSISGVDEIQASISEPAEVASIQTGSSKDAASLEHDDIQKEAIIIEPIDLSALDESDKLEDSINISEVSRTDSAAEEKIEETLPTLDSTQFQIDDISIGTAVQELVESPSSGEQIAKEILLGENMTKSEEQELAAAATKIQASFRGYQTRKEIDVTEMAQEKLVPAVVAAVIEEAGREENATWRALPAQVNDEVDEEQLLSQTDAALAKAHKRYMEENSSPSALEELVQSSTLIAATPLAFADSSPPPSAPTAPHVSQLRNTYSSSGECADVSASVTEPVSWNGGISRVLDEESGELITPDDDEGVWATLEREIGETQEQEYAATKIQAGFRGHRARQALLQREDAVQIATSSASDVSNSPFSGVRHTGEFHDSLLLPLSGDVPNEQQARLVHDTAEEDAANTGAIATGIHEDADVITEQQLIILDQNVTSDYDNMSENSESFLDRAATRIQATFRGFKTRNDIKQKSPVRSPSPADIDAATKIQAGFRGYKVRKDMKNSTSSPKLARIQSAPEIRIQESEEERSATKIQAGVRGYLTRQRLKKERSPQPEPSIPEPSGPELEDAVVKLQAGFRGYKARQDVKLLREGKDVKN